MITTCMSQIDALAVSTDDKWLYNSTQEESAPAHQLTQRIVHRCKFHLLC